MLAIEPAPNKPKWRDWISKGLIFVLSLSLFMEGGARVALSIHPLRRRIVGYDNSSYRLQWIKIHQEHGREWNGPHAIYHPTRGWTLKPAITDMRVFDGTILNSNSKGVRGKTEYEYQRTAGKHRIVVLGDSFTFGAEVPDEETYSYHLASALPNTEVLNLGVQGYGHDQMLLYLKEEGVKYRPDVVMLGFTYVDVYRNIWSFYAYAKPKFELTSGGLRLTNVPVPTPDRVLAREPYRSKALDLLVILRAKLRWNLGENEAEARNLTRALLDEIIATTRSIGATPVFVYLPVGEEIQPFRAQYLAYSPSVEEREQFLRDYCQNRGIPCVLLGPRFREEAKRGVHLLPPQGLFGHWTPEAHRIAAQEIKDFLVKDNLIQISSTPDAGVRYHVGRARHQSGSRWTPRPLSMAKPSPARRGGGVDDAGD
ncbi:MAG TPA: SGNH/GDSL hydrolase family protein [Terriglobia bacterium]|nr:SGNH/GDSL hydrolase family protein [Terriglobia bacterium]